MQTLRLAALVVCAALFPAAPGEPVSKPPLKPSQIGNTPRSEHAATLSIQHLQLQHADASMVAHNLSSILAGNLAAKDARVVADARANVLLISGPAALFAQVTQIVRTLDVPEPRLRTVRMIQLKNCRAAEAHSLLRQVIEQGDPKRGRSERAGIAFDRRSNTLIATATDQEFQMIRSIVEGIDAAQAGESTQYATNAHISIYQVAVPAAQAASMKVDDLRAQAGDAEKFTAAMEKLGTSKMLGRFDQPVDLESQPTLRTSSNVPMVSGETVFNNQKTTQVKYEQLGCSCRLGGHWDDDHPLLGEVSINIELSALGLSDISLTGDEKAPIFLKAEQSMQGAIAAGQPMVLVTLQESGSKETSIAFITRVQFERTEIKS